MRKRDLEQCRTLLLEQRERILGNLGRVLSGELDVDPDDSPDEIDTAVAESSLSFTGQIRERERRLLSKIDTTLAKIDQGYDEIEGSMIETGEVESTKLHQKVGYLSLIASISPMLGLFGTVAGMIDTFHVIAVSETQPKPVDLADGISQALVTTYMGLVVAIPMTVLFVVFRNKVVSIILEVGSLTEDLMSRFKVQKSST